MSAPKVEQVTSSMKLGEGPHWDHRTQVLYFVDIQDCSVKKYDPISKKLTSTKIVNESSTATSLVIPLKGEQDKFIVTLGNQLCLMTWDGESPTPAKLEKLLMIGKDCEGVRFNDGKADSTGLLWAGSLCLNPPGREGPWYVPEKGSLHSLSKHKSTVHATNFNLPNGITWDDDRKVMYFVESLDHKIYAFDFDAQGSQIFNQRECFDYKKNNVDGMPDGMTIDTEGKIWIASFNGSEVVRLDPSTGTLLSRISLPVPQVTSLTFGGPQLDELYVTTASEFMTDEQLKQFPLSGATFRITEVGAKGYPGQCVVF